MAYNFDIKVDNGEYTIEIDTTEHYGCFEHNKLGDESAGGLWFDDNGVLVDYDGVSSYRTPSSGRSSSWVLRWTMIMGTLMEKFYTKLSLEHTLPCGCM